MLNPQDAAEQDGAQLTDPLQFTGKPMTRADRRRKFRTRRRNGKAKTYGTLKVATAAPTPPLPPSMRFGVEPTVHEPHEVSTDQLEELDELDEPERDGLTADTADSGSDTFDGAILMAPDEVPIEFLEAMPSGFHLDDEGRHVADAGGAHQRRIERQWMQRAAVVDPDFDDPEWVYSGCEPRHLPLNNQVAI